MQLLRITSKFGSVVLGEWCKEDMILLRVDKEVAGVDGFDRAVRFTKMWIKGL